MAPPGALCIIMALEQLQPNGGSALPSPYLQLGSVWYKNRPTNFNAIWTLDSHECWIIFDRNATDPHLLEYYPCNERVDTFPGTETMLSVGKLSGLFEGQQLTLEVKGTNGFNIHDVNSVGGELRAIRQECTSEL
jgi:hypothetical protein